jgi:hypothetical protein
MHICWACLRSVPHGDLVRTYVHCNDEFHSWRSFCNGGWFDGNLCLPVFLHNFIATFVLLCCNNSTLTEVTREITVGVFDSLAPCGNGNLIYEMELDGIGKLFN